MQKRHQFWTIFFKKMSNCKGYGILCCHILRHLLHNELNMRAIHKYLNSLEHLCPLCIKLCPCYREKLADLQGTLKLHVRFYNRISRLQRPRNENWHAHYSLHARRVAINAFMSP